MAHRGIDVNNVIYSSLPTYLLTGNLQGGFFRNTNFGLTIGS